MKTGYPNRDGTWIWLQEARAIQKDGYEFYGYIDQYGSIKILRRDLETDETEETTLNHELEVDDHLNPAITILNDGRLLITYARGRPIRYRVSGDPLSISSFDSEQEIDEQANFPQCEQRDGGDVVMFYRRGGGDNYQHFYRISNDLKSTDWQSPVQLTDFGENRAYLKKYRGDGDEIHLIILRANLEDTEDQDFWAHVIFDAAEREVSDSDGNLIATESELPLVASDLDAVDTGENTDINQMRIWDVLIDNGDLRVLTAKMHDRDNHEYYHNRYDGSSWEINKITDAGRGISPRRDYYSGGLCFDHGDPDTVYLSQEDGEGQHQIYDAETTDGGESWSMTQLTDSKRQSIRPAPVHNPSDKSVLWLHGSFDDISKYATRVVSDEPYGRFETVQPINSLPFVGDGEGFDRTTATSFVPDDNS